jgi:hypothetical protein
MDEWDMPSKFVRVAIMEAETDESLLFKVRAFGEAEAEIISVQTQLVRATYVFVAYHLQCVFLKL